MLTENENAMLDNLKQRHAFHGLYRSLVNNMVVGVSEGYKKDLELVGVVTVLQTMVILLISLWVILIISLCSYLLKSRLKLSQKEIRTLLLYWNLVTNNC